MGNRTYLSKVKSDPPLQETQPRPIKISNRASELHNLQTGRKSAAQIQIKTDWQYAVTPRLHCSYLSRKRQIQITIGQNLNWSDQGQTLTNQLQKVISKNLLLQGSKHENPD